MVSLQVLETRRGTLASTFRFRSVWMYLYTSFQTTKQIRCKIIGKIIICKKMKKAWFHCGNYYVHDKGRVCLWCGWYMLYLGNCSQFFEWCVGILIFLLVAISLFLFFWFTCSKKSNVLKIKWLWWIFYIRSSCTVCGQIKRALCNDCPVASP